MLVGLSEQVRPPGETAASRDTVPVKPPTETRGATVIVDVPVAPALTVTVAELAKTVKSLIEVMLKSCSRTVRVTVLLLVKAARRLDALANTV